MYIIHRNMYEHIKACVRVEDVKTSLFNTTSGVRQGCMLSPVLFIRFIHEFVREMENLGLRGIFVKDNFDEIMLLLFADDVILVDDCVIGLQRKLDVSDSYCDKWGLDVNLDKTKVIVFRKGGLI